VRVERHLLERRVHLLLPCSSAAREKVRWQNRAHFFGVSAQLMRRILVDFARAQLSAKKW
jgi:hypothetical protein